MGMGGIRRKRLHVGCFHSPVERALQARTKGEVHSAPTLACPFAACWPTATKTISVFREFTICYMNTIFEPAARQPSAFSRLRRTTSCSDMQADRIASEFGIKRDSVKRNDSTIFPDRPDLKQSYDAEQELEPGKESRLAACAGSHQPSRYFANVGLAENSAKRVIVRNIRPFLRTNSLDDLCHLEALGTRERALIARDEFPPNQLPELREANNECPDTTQAPRSPDYRDATVQTHRPDEFLQPASHVESRENTPTTTTARQGSGDRRVVNSRGPSVRRPRPTPMATSNIAQKLLCATAGISAAVVATILVRGSFLQSNANHIAARNHTAEMQRLHKINNIWNGHPNDGLLIAE